MYSGGQPLSSASHATEAKANCTRSPCRSDSALGNDAFNMDRNGANHGIVKHRISASKTPQFQIFQISVAKKTLDNLPSSDAGLCYSHPCKALQSSTPCPGEASKVRKTSLFLPRHHFSCQASQYFPYLSISLQSPRDFPQDLSAVCPARDFSGFSA